MLFKFGKWKLTSLMSVVISLSWTHANSHIIPSEDFCAPRPCKNGGRCDINIDEDGFDCLCKPRFRGKTCEESLAGSKM